ncbi:DUF3467 domain-containing protein [Ruania halotolerans]|uniref:DUF3467 domain-containing protein n=1 Tax=Ruania halotolerans TaxID=2897773 RepID=UPI001E4F7CF4|nr:DUF3467 domain-containing protein [Ruania halotolerans]UFU05503.1 DUF3467 domain-containing protein [Ruania halotolerans]
MNSEKRDLAITVPEDMHVGVFADFARLWHTSDSFVLDFSTMTAPPASEGSSAEVVARVRIPTAQAWELMRGLERQLTAWEKAKERRAP